MTQQPAQSTRKPYQAPRIAFDTRLEAQAGSPLGDTFDVLNLTGAGK